MPACWVLTATQRTMPLDLSAVEFHSSNLLAGQGLTQPTGDQRSMETAVVFLFRVSLAYVKNSCRRDNWPENRGFLSSV